MAHIAGPRLTQPRMLHRSQGGSLGEVPQAALQNERPQLEDPDGIQE